MKRSRASAIVRLEVVRVKTAFQEKMTQSSAALRRAIPVHTEEAKLL
jgi:hypothetical protein